MRLLLTAGILASSILLGYAQEPRSGTVKDSTRQKVAVQVVVLGRQLPVPGNARERQALLAAEAPRGKSGRTNVFRIFGESERFVCATGFGSNLNSTVGMLLTNRDGRAVLMQLTDITTNGASVVQWVGCTDSAASGRGAQAGPFTFVRAQPVWASVELRLTPSTRPDGTIDLRVVASIERFNGSAAVKRTGEVMGGRTDIKRAGEVLSANATQSEVSLHVDNGEILVVKGLIEPTKGTSKSGPKMVGCEFVFAVRPTVVGGH